MNKFVLYTSLLILISLIAFIVFFGPEPVKFNTVTAGKFSISVPEYLSETDSIDNSALLAYKNEKEKMFLLVYERSDTIDIPLQVLFENFSKDFIGRIGDANLLKYYPKEINSHHAMIGNIRGSVNQTGVYYRIALIQGNHSNYEAIVGIANNNLSGFDEDINRILNSIVILP